MFLSFVRMSTRQDGRALGVNSLNRQTMIIGLIFYVITVVNAQSKCSICGEGFNVGNPDAIFSYGDQPEVSCGLLEAAGNSQQISDGACKVLPELTFKICECQKSPTASQNTDAPAIAATDSPVAPPTESPVDAPVSVPVADTESPTSFPIIPDTPMPSESLTLSPTRTKTEAPVTPSPITSAPVTSAPTSFPSNFPSQRPTVFPSNFPLPTTFPSANPTGLLPSTSPMPSKSSPSSTPSVAPVISTDAPVMPTVSPIVPSKSPIRPNETPVKRTSFPLETTASPTQDDANTPSTEAPSLSIQSYLIEMVMYLHGATEELTGTAEITFQTETARHIRFQFLDDLDDLEVGSNIKNQKVFNTLRERRLQDRTSTTLRIVFDTAISFRSPIQNLDVVALIRAAFDNTDDRNQYLARLKAVGGQPFSSIQFIEIEINGVPQPITDPESQGGAGVALPVIIGSTVGGSAFLAILIFIFLKQRKKKTHDDNLTFTSSKKDPMHEHVNTNILVQPQDDISTLGDPMPRIFVPQHQDDVSTLGEPLVDAALDRDETVAGSTVTGDYDYFKAYANKGDLSSQDSLLQKDASASTLGKMEENDNDGLSVEESPYVEEYRYEVRAPAGKLGMVIDTPSGGAPVVHAIKDTSSMKDMGVIVGDRLVAVDGIDTTGLTAMQVSKLISQKASNPERVLAFVRVKTRGNPQ
jgi:hypothetical protein